MEACVYVANIEAEEEEYAKGILRLHGCCV